jgi:hypothetical protein
MLRAVVTPKSYGVVYTTLPHEYYLLVALMAGGYFIYVGIAELLVLGTTRYREKLRGPEHLAMRPVTRLRPVLGRSVLWVDGVLAERKWWWLTPVFVLLLVVTSLSVFSQSSNIAPFIYTLF